MLNSAASWAQPIGNEWIDYKQQYFKMRIIDDGIYRINFTTLESAGLSVTNIDPRYLQLFWNGVEQPIYIHGDQDGSLDAGDYIEFYGQHNDGRFDQYLYNNPLTQPNPAYSLINDTSTYFLTINDSLNNKRYTYSITGSTAGYTPISYFLRTVRNNYAVTYYNGATYNNNFNETEYVETEGWFDSELSLGNTITRSINTDKAYASGPDATLDMLIIGASNYSSIVNDHHLIINYLDHIVDTIYEGYTQIRHSNKIAASKLSTSTLFTLSSSNDIGSKADRSALSYISLTYPHKPDFENSINFKFQMPATTQAKSLLSFSNVDITSGDSVLIFDLTSNNRIRATMSGLNGQVLIPTIGSDKNCIMTTGKAIKEITKLIPVNKSLSNFAKFTNYLTTSAQNSDYIIITHTSLLSSATKYKNYRTATGYKTLMADVEDLYDQFAYGIVKHPLAIRNFLRKCYTDFAVKPKYLFLIGKGYRAGDNSNYTYRYNTYYWGATLIPAYGTPPSDIMYTQKFDDLLYKPGLATGRLNAKNNNDVEIYLEKMKDYETAQLQPKEWMKNVMHFGGGMDKFEQLQFSTYLNNYKTIIEDTLFGASVSSFFKVSSNPLQINRSDSLRQMINNGVSLMTFFGHAAGIGFDQSTDVPSEYQNYQKYFFLLANSCYAGDLFTNIRSSSEEFVLIEDKGAIGYVSSISKASAGLLNRFSSELYKQITYKLYGHSIGECIQASIKQVQYDDVMMQDMLNGLALHGDPALKINYFGLPDLVLDAQSAYFSPTTVQLDDKSFKLHIISSNIGKAVNDSMFIQISHKTPEGVKFDTIIRVPVTHNKDTIVITYPLNSDDLGTHTFTVTLDASSEITETSETNNTYTYSLVVKSNDIIPIYPYEFAVIPKNTSTLTGFTFQLSPTPLPYAFEIDTTEQFIQPLARTVISHIGGVINWQPPVVFTDCTVYYWRVSIDSSYKGKYNWRGSSFQYIPNKYGWGQADFEQFKKNEFDFLEYLYSGKVMKFIQNIINITAQNTIWYGPDEWKNTWIRNNGSVMEIGNCGGPTFSALQFAVFNPVTGKPWYSYNVAGYYSGKYLGPFGNYHCKNYDVPTFVFSIQNTSSFTPAAATQQEWFNRIEDFIDSIPVGYRVFVSSYQTFPVNQFSHNLIHALKQIGCVNVETALPNAPYMCFGTKYNDTIHGGNESFGQNSTSVIKLNDTIITSWNEGNMISTTIGPAAKWGSLHWRFTSKEKPIDNVRVQVIGVKGDESETKLISNLVFTKDIDYYNLDNQIDASVYPMLKLQAFFIDDDHRTPPNWSRWQVIYEGVPETAVDQSSVYLSSDTVQEGGDFIFSFSTKNISDFDFNDSLMIHYWLIDENLNYIDLGYKLTHKHPAGDVLTDTLHVETLGLSGKLTLWMEANPVNPATGMYDQTEQYHFNNSISTIFFVERDKANPILDVTFDGIHILNNDIVSPTPEIYITLKDENKYLAITDTSAFRLFIQHPESDIIQPLYFADAANNLLFIPASLPTNKCQIKYSPTFTHDGSYTLYIQGKDKSNNYSGNGSTDLVGNYDYDYKISFKIVNKSTITQVLNWPNPFTTSTRFVFILTGRDIPTTFKIQIMNVTGKIVKEITQDEFGPIHIGRNISDYAWDGTDTYGDRLANGVYLYRVVCNIQGKTIENYASEADKFFTKEFGKLYIMR